MHFRNSIPKRRRATTPATAAITGLLMVIVLMLPAPVPAPIHGTFTSLDSALGESDMVAVIRILDSPTARRMRESGDYNRPKLTGGQGSGLFDDFGVYVVKTLEGELHENKRLILSLRFIDTRTLSKAEEHKLIWGTAEDGATTPVLHLAFLTKHPFSPYYKPHWEPASAFAVNCTNSVLPLHPETNLSVARDLPLHEAITALFEDSRQRYAGTEYEAAGKAYVDWCAGIPIPGPGQ